MHTASKYVLKDKSIKDRIARIFIEAAHSVLTDAVAYGRSRMWEVAGCNNNSHALGKQMRY
jgi:hypothetical protein